MVGRRGEAPLVPPYRFRRPNKAMALRGTQRDSRPFPSPAITTGETSSPPPLRLPLTTMPSTELTISLQSAADVLKLGGLVALPTETVYGLGANEIGRAHV